MKRFEVHSHTHYSNFRLLDCINRPKKLIDKAVELGLSGIAITDHETLASHIEVNQYAKKVREKNPEFKVALGNEIYLCPDRNTGQKYYHFILIAKNATGHRALRELSSRAWMNSYYDRGMERVVTTYSDLVEIVLNKYPNSLIATTACLGGQLSTQVLTLHNAEKTLEISKGTFGETEREEAYNNIVEFISFCKWIFGEDFYIECAPGLSRDQKIVNERLVSIANAFDVKMVIGTDSHYLTSADRYVHKAYLNSKEGDREVDDFYEYSYLQSDEDIKKNLNIIEEYENLYLNSQEIYKKIEDFSLEHKQTIPRIPEIELFNFNWAESSIPTPVLYELNKNGNGQERYWVYNCLSQLKKINKINDEKYMSRLETEAKIIKTIGEKLDDCLFAYFNTFKHYIDMFWECGSIVGPGRGSATGFLSNYLLGITQLDPIEWELPYWRFLNEERAELPDIDIDLAPSKRPLILKKIKEERGKNFNPDIDDLSRANLGTTLIATYGTEGTKSAVLTACRGYRSEEYKDGIDSDIAQYMSSLIPSERGFLWPLNDVINGNEDKDRKPIKTFINKVNEYPGLLDIMIAIEGLVNKRSSHASGVIMFDEDPYKFGCFMKTPSGDIITQYDLHMCEAGGMTKYDFLVTEISDKIIQCILLLEEFNQIPKMKLRKTYDTYLHPQSIDISDSRIWNALGSGSVLDCFQFSTDVGLMAAKKLKPQNPNEMTDANALMRLMAPDKGGEAPIDKYSRFKNNFPDLWYNEMSEYGVTNHEYNIIKSIYEPAYGCPSIQEDLMILLMRAANFTLAEANDARKIVGKKQMSRIPELQNKIFTNVPHEGFARYIWDTGIKPQLGYAFSRNHSLPYSFVGIQSLVLATSFNPIFWNTSCLIVNSGSLDGYDNDDEEDEENNGKKKEKSTDYAKIAKALGDIISRGIKVSLVDINKSSHTFVPDIENNEILFGMKALNNVGMPIIEQIIAGRPYFSFKDFLERCPLNKSAMFSLIKAGAFDKLELDIANELKVDPRYVIMAMYISKASEPKTKLTLQNFNGLMQRDMIPDSLSFVKRVFIFNKYLKDNAKVGKYFVLDDISYEFYSKYFDMDSLDIINGCSCILQTKWQKIYNTQMDEAREWLVLNQTELLNELNTSLALEMWDKYASGSISAWEMESMCFYYHEHELANVDTQKYGIVNFFSLPEEPEVDYFFKRGGKQIPIYKTYKIIGTVISKNDSKSTITLLTTSGIVNVKFTKEYFAMFGRQISEKQEDGTKKVMEKGWFQRGTKVMCTGFRRGDTFQTKTYKNTPTHQLYKITNVNNNGTIELEHERYSQGEE